MYIKIETKNRDYYIDENNLSNKKLFLDNIQRTKKIIGLDVKEGQPFIVELNQAISLKRISENQISKDVLNRIKYPIELKKIERGLNPMNAEAFYQES